MRWWEAPARFAASDWLRARHNFLDARTLAGDGTAAPLPRAQWSISCAHAQTRNSCKKAPYKRLRTRPNGAEKGDFAHNHLVHRKRSSFGLSNLHHLNHLEALTRAIAFAQPGRRFPARRTYSTVGDVSIL